MTMIIDAQFRVLTCASALMLCQPCKCFQNRGAAIICDALKWTSSAYPQDLRLESADAIVNFFSFVYTSGIHAF